MREGTSNACLAFAIVVEGDLILVELVSRVCQDQLSDALPFAHVGSSRGIRRHGFYAFRSKRSITCTPPRRLAPSLGAWTKAAPTVQHMHSGSETFFRKLDANISHDICGVWLQADEARSRTRIGILFRIVSLLRNLLGAVFVCISSDFELEGDLDGESFSCEITRRHHSCRSGPDHQRCLSSVSH